MGKSIQDGNEMYRYSDIKFRNVEKNPEVALGFKANFYKMTNENEPYEGYNILLNYIKKKMNENYFICKSNADNYFERAGLIKVKYMKIIVQ